MIRFSVRPQKIKAGYVVRRVLPESKVLSMAALTASHMQSNVDNSFCWNDESRRQLYELTSYSTRFKAGAKDGGQEKRGEGGHRPHVVQYSPVLFKPVGFRPLRPGYHDNCEPLQLPRLLLLLLLGRALM
ncbi:hypothetical protein CRENBAI_026344 [Crenichthys baileyi]|uniref:Uncharacterized protein n=1 Tax=Crenichthys baileyi TaxID=28760 RepID=A0AAV9QR08_9TELE